MATEHNASGAQAPCISFFAPCPFCGKPVGYITSLYGYRVVCDVCDIYGPRGRDNAEARERWNQRSNARSTTRRRTRKLRVCDERIK